MSKQKSTLETQQQRLLESIKAGINPAALSVEINSLHEQIQEMECRIKQAKNNPPSQTTIDEMEIRSFLCNFETVFDNADIEQRKKLIRTFVRRLEMDPVKEEIRVFFYPDSVVQSIGVGGLTYLQTHTLPA